jgi:hypothetical protein
MPGTVHMFVQLDNLPQKIGFFCHRALADPFEFTPLVGRSLATADAFGVQYGYQSSGGYRALPTCRHRVLSVPTNKPLAEVVRRASWKMIHCQLEATAIWAAYL